MNQFDECLSNRGGAILSVCWFFESRSLRGCSLFIIGHMFRWVCENGLLVRERRKRRDGRGEESERKTAAWKTSGRQPVCHHLDEEARASPVSCERRGGRDTREYAMRNTVIVRRKCNVATQPHNGPKSLSPIHPRNPFPE